MRLMGWCPNWERGHRRQTKKEGKGVGLMFCELREYPFDVCSNTEIPLFLIG